MKKHTDSITQEIDDLLIDQIRKIDYSGVNIYDRDYCLIMDNSPIIRSGIFIDPIRTHYYRIFLIKKGFSNHSLNYNENHVSAGELVAVPSNIIVKVNSFSKDFIARCVAFRPSSIMAGNPLEYKFIKLRLGNSEEQIFETYFQLMNQVLIHQTADMSDFELLLRSMLQRIRSLDIAQNGRQPKALGTRKQTLFSEFMQLINRDEIVPRTVTDYAKKLHVTDNYLSVTVKKLSGKTVMEWVNGRTIAEIKTLLLEQPTLSIDQIAEKLKFSSASQMIRLFRNQTGYTPAAFRKAHNEMLKSNQSHS